MGSWRCRFSAHRESKRTAFRLLQHNEKSSFPLKEVCTRCIVDASHAHRRAFVGAMRAHRHDIGGAIARFGTTNTKCSMK
jgi:hypothetical protein